MTVIIGIPVTKAEARSRTAECVVTFTARVTSAVVLSHVGAETVAVGFVPLYTAVGGKYGPVVGNEKTVLVGVAAWVWFEEVVFVPLF